MKRLEPGDFKLDNLLHIERWMCSNCGLIFDHHPLCEDGQPGWPVLKPLGDPRSGDLSHRWLCTRCGVDFDVTLPVPVVVSLMTLSDLSAIIQQGEGETLEFKKTFPQNANDLRKNIASFANTHGGKIILGINDSGKLVGLQGIDTPEGKDALQKRVYGLLDKIEPRVKVRMAFLSDTTGVHVAIIEVSKGKGIHVIDGTIYIRELSQTRPATAEEITALVHRREDGSD